MAIKILELQYDYVGQDTFPCSRLLTYKHRRPYMVINKTLNICSYNIYVGQDVLPCI